LVVCEGRTFIFNNNMAAPVAKYWALLIGINDYKELGLKDLDGPVRDVALLKRYLTSTEIPMNVITMTAHDPEDPERSLSSEIAKLRPTVDNVINNLEDITMKAKAGDYIYIHFSGHGTTMKRRSPQHASEKEHLALILCPAEQKSLYLEGRQLASLLNTMVKNGLLVTLVLDCCFSGKVTRADDEPSARTAPYDPKFDDVVFREFSPSVGATTSTGQRTVHLLSDSLMDPVGYTILTACGPHEIAREIEDSEKKKNGALSYFLYYALNALRRRGAEITHLSLYQLLRLQFHAKWPCQTPMRYGNRSLSFFGKLIQGSETTFIPAQAEFDSQHLKLLGGRSMGIKVDDLFAIFPLTSSDADASTACQTDTPIFKVIEVHGSSADLAHQSGEEMPRTLEGTWEARSLSGLEPASVGVLRKFDAGSIRLDGGHAQGINVGDEFAVFSYYASEGDAPSLSQTTSSIYEAVQVKSLTSTLVLRNGKEVPPTYGGLWKAKLVKASLNQRIKVRLMSTVPDQQGLIEHITERRFLEIVNPEDTSISLCQFNLTIDRNGHYEVLDQARRRVPNVPSIPASNDAVPNIMQVLEHLAAFKYFEAIENSVSAAAFENSFRVDLKVTKKHRPQDQGTAIKGDENENRAFGFVELEEGDEVTLAVENLSYAAELYVCIFNLTALWEIQSLLSEESGQGFMALERKPGEGDIEEMDISPNVPDLLKKRGQSMCVDVIKVFLTSRPSTFAPWLLPAISRSVDMLGSSSGMLKNISTFLDGLLAPMRGKPHDEWATRTFIIRTTALAE